MNTFVNVYCNHKTQIIFKKATRYLRKHAHKQMPLIIGTFFIISMMSTVILAMLGHGYLRFGDIVFHYNRLMELHDDIKHGVYPLVNRFIGYPLGAGTNIFYPYLTWLPFVILTFIFKQPLTVFYVALFGIIFSRFLISFYCYKTLDPNRFHSFIFAMLYTVNASVFYWTYVSEDIGASMSTNFLPIVMCGLIAYLNKGHWKMLSIGLALIAYSHIVTALLAVIFVGVLLTLNINLMTTHKAMNLAKATLATLLLTCFQWFPLLKIMTSNMVMTPGSDKVQFGQGLFTQLGIAIPIVTILIAFSRHWKMTRFDKQLFWIGLFCFLINSSILGNFMASIFPLLHILQFSIRFCVIEYLVFPYLIMRYLCSWSPKETVREHQSFVKFMMLTMLFIMPCVLSINSTKRIRRYKPVTAQFTTHMITNIATGNFHATFLKNKINNNELKNMQYRDYYMDYFPVQATQPWHSLLHQKPNVITYKGTHEKNKLTAENTPKGLVVTAPHRLQNVQLPIAVYKGINYKFTINNHLLRQTGINKDLTRNHNLLTVKNLQKGKNMISIHSTRLII